MGTVKLRLTVEIDVDETAVRSEIAGELEAALTTANLEDRGTAYWALPQHWETAKVVQADWDLPSRQDPPAAPVTLGGPGRFVLDGRLRLRPVATDEEADSLAQAVLRNDREAVDRLVDAMGLENGWEVRNTMSALSWFHDQGPAYHGPRMMVHQLSVSHVEEGRALLLCPPQVLVGDLLAFERGGRIMWRLAMGNEGGTLVTVLEDEEGPRPPSGWTMAAWTPVARLGRRPGAENWTMGLVGADGKLRAHDGTELDPVW